MASSTPTPAPTPEAQSQSAAGSLAPVPWWQRWLEPVISITIIIALVTALISGGVTAFQSLKSDISSLKGDVNAAEARLTETIRTTEIKQGKRLDEVKVDLKDLRVELKADNASLKAELKGDISELKAELKGDIGVMGDRLDRMLESLIATQS